MSVWQILLEVLLLAYVAYVIFTNAKNGLVKTFLNGLKSIVVILFAAILTPFFSRLLGEFFVAGWFENTITPQFVEAAKRGGENFNMEAIMSQLPDAAKGVMSMINDGSLSNFEGNGVELAYELGNKLEGLIINIVSYIMTYSLLSILLFVLVTILFKVLEKIVQIPILDQSNHILGCVWGVVTAYIQVSFIVFILPFLTGIEFIQGTYFSRFMYEFGLFSFFNNMIL